MRYIPDEEIEAEVQTYLTEWQPPANDEAEPHDAEAAPLPQDVSADGVPADDAETNGVAYEGHAAPCIFRAPDHVIDRVTRLLQGLSPEDAAPFLRALDTLWQFQLEEHFARRILQYLETYEDAPENVDEDEAATPAADVDADAGPASPPDAPESVDDAPDTESAT